MKKSFKQFLKESISVSKDSLLITNQKDQRGSTKQEISTFFRKLPYETKLKGVDNSIYSILNYQSSSEMSNILSSLKGKGPYNVVPKQLDNLLNDAAKAAKPLLIKLDPDLLIYPKSNSELLKMFISKLKIELSGIDIVDDGFIKNVELDAENIEHLLNKDHPDWKKFNEEHPKEVDKFKKELERNVKRGPLELKKIYKPYLKFVKNFIKFRDEGEALDKVIDKNVLVIDDILSSGSTMIEMIRQLKEFEPKSLNGLTLFKRSDS